jgi:hypothetical protein
MKFVVKALHVIRNIYHLQSRHLVIDLSAVFEESKETGVTCHLLTLILTRVWGLSTTGAEISVNDIFN